MDISQNSKEKKSESGPSEFATSEDSPINIPPKKNKKYATAFNQTNNLQYAVNCEYVNKNSLVKNEDELAIFPPVNGG